jgi:hypothetical protein
MSYEQLEVITAAFRRLRLIGEEETLPTPFRSIYGEAEQAGILFFEIKGQPVAVKLSEPESLRSLWKEVRDFRAQARLSNEIAFVTTSSHMKTPSQDLSRICAFGTTSPGYFVNSRSTCIVFGAT